MLATISPGAGSLCGRLSDAADPAVCSGMKLKDILNFLRNGKDDGQNQSDTVFQAG